MLGVHGELTLTTVITIQENATCVASKVVTEKGIAQILVEIIDRVELDIAAEGDRGVATRHFPGTREVAGSHGLCLDGLRRGLHIGLHLLLSVFDAFEAIHERLDLRLQIVDLASGSRRNE